MVTIQLGQKNFLLLKKLKNMVQQTCVTEDLHGEEIAGTFYEKTIADKSNIVQSRKSNKENG